MTLLVWMPDALFPFAGPTPTRPACVSAACAETRPGAMRRSPARTLCRFRSQRRTIVSGMCSQSVAGLARANAFVRLAFAALAVGLTVALAGCGDQTPAAPVALPSSGKAYRALSDGDRLAVAESCRDRAAARAGDTAAEQIRAIESKTLRTALDDAFTITQDQRRAVAGVCAGLLPFVTPGLEVSLAGAKDDGDGSFSYETTSDRRLTISGRIRPAPAHGRVVLRREVGAPAPHTVPIAADGRFVFPNLHLRKVADNSFTLSIQAAPNAPRNVHVSAICLDCLAGNTPPSE
jgi:hypothetical protein